MSDANATTPRVFIARHGEVAVKDVESVITVC